MYHTVGVGGLAAMMCSCSREASALEAFGETLVGSFAGASPLRCSTPFNGFERPIRQRVLIGRAGWPALTLVVSQVDTSSPRSSSATRD